MWQSVLQSRCPTTELVICRRSPDMLYAKPVIPRVSPQMHACIPGKPLQPAMPEPANCRALPRWWGPSAGFHMFAAVSVRRYLPQLFLPTPTLRSWGTLLPVLRPRRYPECLYPSLI